MSEMDIIKEFLHHASAKGSRSSALAPIGWMMAILIAAVFSVFYFNAPIFIAKIFLGFCGLAMLLYLSAYIYFMLKNPDALRSERYSLEKLAIEKGLIGDNIHGLIKPKEVPQITASKKISDE